MKRITIYILLISSIIITVACDRGYDKPLKISFISNNASIDRNPAWSPDGKKIVFDSDRSGNYQIYAMNSDGSSVNRISGNSYDETFSSFQYKPR